MMQDIEPFREMIKPPMFPMRLDPRTSKYLEVEDGSAFYGVNQSDSFSQAVSKVSSVLNRDLTRTQTQLDELANNPKYASNPELAKKIIGQRTLSKVYEGFSFLPQDVLAKADQMKNRYNFERVNDPDYVYLPDVLKPMYSKSTNEATLETQIFGQQFFSDVDENPGQAATSPHNLNLFHGVGSNPFKAGDKSSFQAFQKSPYYSALHTDSMTPRNILQKLDPTFWQMVNNSVDALTTTDYDALTPEDKRRLKNPYGQTDGLNWYRVADPYSDSKTETFDIRANFHTIVSSQLWTTWDDSRIFMFMNRLWESSTRVDDVLRELIGKASDMPVVNPDGTTPDGLSEQNDARQQKMLDHVDSWWDNVGSGLDDAALLPFGLLAAFTPLMQTMKDWGNWADQIEANAGIKKSGDSFGFKEKMISGYLNYAADHYVFEKFRGTGKIAATDLQSDSRSIDDAIYGDLIAKGYLSATGELTDKFNPADPEFVLNINFNDGERRRVRDVLRQAAVGSFSLDVQDKTMAHGERRSGIKVEGADGNMYSLPDLVDLFRSGETPYDQIKNAQLAYNTLFDINAQLTGLADGLDTNGSPNLTVKNGLYEVKVAENGTWTEWDPASSKWVQKTGPVAIQFNTIEDANAFRDNIRVLIAMLEPVVGVFGPDAKTEGGRPFKMLVDNAGSSDSVDMITATSSNYKLSTDSLYDRDLFGSDAWAAVSKDLQRRVIVELQASMFGKSSANAVARGAHKRKKEAYEDAKYQYEIDEINRMIREMEEQTKRDKEENEVQQRRKEEMIRIEKEAQKRQEEETAKRAASSKQKK